MLHLKTLTDEVRSTWLSLAYIDNKLNCFFFWRTIKWFKMHWLVTHQNGISYLRCDSYLKLRLLAQLFSNCTHSQRTQREFFTTLSKYIALKTQLLLSVYMNSSVLKDFYGIFPLKLKNGRFAWVQRKLKSNHSLMIFKCLAIFAQFLWPAIK